ncbi:MOSC domain protein beta barrel domain protein [Kribbella flavida DSM 17836]|uniref:MOSC domain protein beta barrel domain protein n=1 Tax=Kribbella flavida (strain DSM 17836 / JCM 10339 / NBRC 14399) TaxID=479435 RepID=D2Q479_KRIFD|nr:MOSC N-terminal beta barrel domain-containing protein [Kribbella flavida]ADB30393.1 MOSC domain protein beta barrel domain protein [Kribbella flavida DSM 17836]
MSDARVSTLTYYPVKGLAGVSVERAEAGAAGLQHDRSFMLVEPDGTFLSQRSLPAMARLHVDVLDDGAGLRLSADGANDLEIQVAYDGKRRDVSLFGKWFGAGVVQDPAADAWFTEQLGRSVALVRVTPEHERPGWGVHPGQTLFGDAHALLIVSVASIDELNARIVEGGGEPIPVNRFRPNIVVSGWPEPHTEDTVLTASVGTLELGYAARAIRCAVPTVNQATGEKNGPEPTRTLARYRRQPDYGGGVSFGLKAAVLQPGTVAVGDVFTVHEWLPEGSDPAPSTR